MPARHDPGAQRLRAKTTRQRWVLVALGASLVASVGWRLVASEGPETTRASEAATTGSASDAIGADLRIVVAHEPEGEVELDMHLFETPKAKDVHRVELEPPAPPAAAEPTEPVVDTEALVRDAAARLDLRGVICGHNNAALINGNYFREGETVAGFRVICISPDLVELERDGVLVSLEL